MKKKFSYLVIAGVGIMFVFACDKVYFFNDDPVVWDSTKRLVHRGGPNETFPENSLSGCINALPVMEGLEVDVQMSADRTIWLSHEPIVMDCERSLGCFAETPDSEIENIRNCTDSTHAYSRLEDLFKYMADNNIKKYICIDMKEWVPCGLQTLNVPELFKLEAEEILELGEQYDLIPYLLFEAQVAYVLQHIELINPAAMTYLNSIGDYDLGIVRALENGCDGMSFKVALNDELDAEKMNLLHQKGLRLMAWNVPDSAYLAYLKSIKVDFIQLDLHVL